MFGHGGADEVGEGKEFSVTGPPVVLGSHGPTGRPEGGEAAGRGVALVVARPRCRGGERQGQVRPNRRLLQPRLESRVDLLIGYRARPRAGNQPFQPVPSQPLGRHCVPRRAGRSHDFGGRPAFSAGRQSSGPDGERLRSNPPSRRRAERRSLLIQDFLCYRPGDHRWHNGAVTKLSSDSGAEDAFSACRATAAPMDAPPAT